MTEKEIEIQIGQGGVAEYNFFLKGVLKTIKCVPIYSNKEILSQFQVSIVTKEGIPIFIRTITKPELFSIVTQPLMYDERRRESEYSSFGHSEYFLNDELYIRVTGIIGQKLNLVIRWD